MSVAVTGGVSVCVVMAGGGGELGTMLATTGARDPAHTQDPAPHLGKWRLSRVTGTSAGGHT